VPWILCDIPVERALDPVDGELGEWEDLGWLVVEELMAAPDDVATLVDDVAALVKKVSSRVYFAAPLIA